jgi:predicted pyridoxine 5'-phosphate oxidase superfamily flavin-nucleotide-binding protein
MHVSLNTPLNTPLNVPVFHADELRAQQLAGVLTPADAPIREQLPDQHRTFFAGLPYLFLSAIDPDGWPVATVLTGTPGFATSPDPGTLHIAAASTLLMDMSNATEATFGAGRQIGILGLDLATRRRNRVNGKIKNVEYDARGISALTLAVDQSFGNCPQYIQRRSVQPAAVPALASAPVSKPDTTASAQEHRNDVEKLDRLDMAARAMIAAADTFFVASRSRPEGDPEENSVAGTAANTVASTVAHSARNAGADISHRGGKPGFVHVHADADAGTDDLWIPDFPGNGYFNTLGNLLGEPRAALLFIDFTTGTVLHLQGLAEIHWHPQAINAQEGAERFWRFRVQRGWRLEAALALRWSFNDASPMTARTGVWHQRSGLPGAAIT